MRAGLALLAGTAIATAVAEYLVDGLERVVLTNVSWTAAATFAVLAVAAGTRKVAPENLRPWLFLLAGTVAWLAGQLAWDIVQAVGLEPTMPSFFDVGWLAFAVLAGVGLYRFSPASPAIRQIAQLDAAVISAVAAALSVSLFWDEIAASRLDAAAIATAVAYAAFYLALAGTIAQALIGAPRALLSPGLVLVFVGVACQSAAFVQWTPQLLAETYVQGTAGIDVVWTVGMVLVGLGGLLAGSSGAVPASTERDLRWRAVLPLGLVLGGLAYGMELVLHGHSLESQLALLSGLALGIAFLLLRSWKVARLYLDLLQEERAARAALAESEERFALAVEGSRDGIWDWDIARNRVFFSPRWKSMLGYAAHELPDEPRTWLRLIHPDDAELARAALREALEDGNRYELEHRLRHRDGSYRVVLSRAVIRRDASGRAIRVSGSHSDHTELRRVQEELVRSNDELEAFAYTASHDLRAPLVSIDGFAEAIVRMEGDSLSPKSRHYIERIRSNAGSLQRLVKDMLAYARVRAADEAGASTDTEAVAREVAAAVESRLAGEPVEVVVHPGLPAARIEPMRLRQALTNLVENAVTHAAGDDSVRVEISAAAANGNVEIAVEDNGRGISPAERERMFELFERGRQARERSPDGTGVGLALVKKIAETAGGSLRYEDAPDHGARFVLELPKGSR